MQNMPLLMFMSPWKPCRIPSSCSSHNCSPILELVKLVHYELCRKPWWYNFRYMCFWFKGQTCRHAQILDTVLAHTLWKLLFLQQRNWQEWDIYTSDDISTDRHRSVPKYTSFTCTRCIHRTLPHLNLKSFHCKFISLIKEDDEQWEED